MGSKIEIKWLEAPEEHNYPAAEFYLRVAGLGLFEPTETLEGIAQIVMCSSQTGV